jgi:hypothetical protein
MPSKKKPIASYSFKKIDFSEKGDVLYFDALTVPEKRLYVGRYIKQSDLKCFINAMMRFRRVGTMKKETIQQMINRGDWKGSIRFIQSDYNTESYFSKQGDSLIEVAIKADAENYSRYSQLILKKVLDDYNYYKTKGKTITSITQNKHLGHLILQHGKSDAAKQEIIRYLARHPSTKQRLPHIINTHHYNGTNTRHLSNHANALGNTQTAQTIRNLLQRQENSVDMFNMRALHNLVNQQLRENRKNNNIKSNTGMSNVSSSAGTVRRPPPPVSMSGLTGPGASQASAAPQTTQRMNNIRKVKTQQQSNSLNKALQTLNEVIRIHPNKLNNQGVQHFLRPSIMTIHKANIGNVRTLSKANQALYNKHKNYVSNFVVDELIKETNAIMNSTKDIERIRKIRQQLNKYNTYSAVALKERINTFMKSNKPANSQGSQRSTQM